MPYLPRCPPVQYSENKNIVNTSNNQSSLGTKKSIYSNLIQQNIGKKGSSKINFSNLKLNAFGYVEGTPGGINGPIRNTFG